MVASKHYIHPENKKTQIHVLDEWLSKFLDQVPLQIKAVKRHMGGKKSQ